MLEAGLPSVYDTLHQQLVFVEPGVRVTSLAVQKWEGGPFEQPSVLGYLKLSCALRSLVKVDLAGGLLVELH